MPKLTTRGLARKCINDKNIEIIQVDYNMNTKNYCPDGNITITIKARIVKSDWKIIERK